VPLLMTLKYIWRSFQPRLSFPRPFQLSLVCFRVARSPSNSWASCKCDYCNTLLYFIYIVISVHQATLMYVCMYFVSFLPCDARKSTTLVDPEMTLVGNYSFIHPVALHTCVSEPTTKICMKIDPYYQRQKCSSGILVSSKVSFMRIFARVRWRGGVKWEWGGRKWRFSLISLAISSEPPHLLYGAM